VRTGREEIGMVTPPDGRSPPQNRPGPKPWGRTVVPLTITVTPSQRTALEARADAERVSISAVVRRFVAAGLAAVTEPPLAPIPVAIARVRRRAAKERTP
jgi:hypothetical protein